ncbi:MAG: glycosyltransferase [Williamsia sp.]|nr:glycosyltransferase [Williamsia sp.]
MKIVHCFYSMEAGGAQVLAIDLMNQLCAEHQVSLVVVNDIWSNAVLSQLDKRVRVYFIKRQVGSRNPIPLLKLNLLLLRLRPDVIHCHEYNMGQIIRVGKGKLLYTIHDVGISVSLYHHYNTLVAISDTVYREVAAIYPHNLKKVYNGIGTHLFKPRQVHVLRQQEPIRLVQVSRLLHEKKGQDILLRAMQLIRDQYGFDQFTLDFIGSGASHDYLVQLTRELGLQNQVQFLGDKNRSWMFAHLCDYHVLVQPSRYEGFGLTVIEGFAAGLPVLASNIEGPAEIIHNVPGGFLFENGSVESCADQVYRIIKQYTENKLDGVAGETAHLLKEKYSIEACTRGYLREYAQLAAS